MAKWAMEDKGYSQRRASQLFGISRSAMRYQARNNDVNHEIIDILT
jgi:predicted transcriptional regulator